MSHRQSCDRCRQQKVRCIRDEVQGEENDPSIPGLTTSLSRCERCLKAGVSCVYSLKQRSSRRSIQTSARRGTDPGPGNLNGASWFDQGLAEALYPGGPSMGADFSDLVNQFPSVDESGVVPSFNGWDANFQSFSTTSLNPLPALSAADEPSISTAPSTTDGHEDSDNVDDDKDVTDVLSSQLASLSRRATRAMRRLVRPGRGPLTVSSPEVNEALEDTNTLIRIINNITAPERSDVNVDQTTTDYGLAFSALACHQHLVALFRAICDAIHRCLQSKKEHQQQHRRSRQHSPSSVAQFVMVLQLLMHLINRVDRSLFQNNPAMWQRAGSSTSGYVTPVTPNMTHSHSVDPMHSEEAAGGGSTPHSGLLVLVQDIVGTISSEHEKLRQVIQKLQTEMEHSELL